MRAVQICMLARAARYRILSSIFNRGGHKSIKYNRSMHSPDRLGIDYLCIAPIDYLWLFLIIDRVLKYGTDALAHIWLKTLATLPIAV